MTRTGEFLALPILSVSSPTGNSSLSQLIEAQAHAHTHAHTHTLLHSHKKHTKKARLAPVTARPPPSSTTCSKKRRKRNNTLRNYGVLIQQNISEFPTAQNRIHIYTPYIKINLSIHNILQFNTTALQGAELQSRLQACADYQLYDTPRYLTHRIVPVVFQVSVFWTFLRWDTCPFTIRS